MASVNVVSPALKKGTSAGGSAQDYTGNIKATDEDLDQTFDYLACKQNRFFLAFCPFALP